MEVDEVTFLLAGHCRHGLLRVEGIHLLEWSSVLTTACLCHLCRKRNALSSPRIQTMHQWTTQAQVLACRATRHIAWVRARREKLMHARKTSTVKVVMVCTIHVMCSLEEMFIQRALRQCLSELSSVTCNGVCWQLPCLRRQHKHIARVQIVVGVETISCV